MSGNLGSLLDEAKATICGERQDQYGRAEAALIAWYGARYSLKERNL